MLQPRPHARFPFTLRQPGAFVASAFLASAAGAQTAVGPVVAAAADARSPALTITVTGSRVDGYTVPDSASATKLTLSPRETPQSMTVITRQRLEDQDLTSLRQVLDNTPGIYSNAYDSERVLFYARG
jgi:outer membrane receptor for ferric coprogen and ferric-rhodotorulic acid